MPRLFDVVVVALLLPIASSVLGYVSYSNRNEAIPKLEMTVSEGKPLKMGVFNYENLQTYIPRWYHDGRLITADYKRCIANYGELRCPSMTLQDKGLYELWGTSRTNVGLRQLLFHANVAVEEEEEEEEEEERVQMAAIEDLPYEERDDCFCSGVTGRCRTANYLYRARVPDECWSDRTKPCMVLIGKNDLTVGYFLPEDATSKPFYVPIKETSWKVLRSERLPYGSVVDRFDFLYLLSKVRVIYLANHTTRRDSQLVVDVASTQDTGLGWVGTVEECDCHEGYRGLSCESCDDGYYRSYDTISKNGICLRLEQLWYMHKRQHRLT
ncbi:uncharacterized protein LOC125953892 isoform X3 [Anopheles darlingi]|uniref:uncharacterized protein LOC125953892 isoform X3 n=1 Tax=Anopheles darlingi TaxID=43151 RepID=UPI0021003DC4|nr:uncharacterized protein LOC125953892 isoform X3 [Anopheles darlingi]